MPSARGAIGRAMFDGTLPLPLRQKVCDADADAYTDCPPDSDPYPSLDLDI